MPEGTEESTATETAAPETAPATEPAAPEAVHPTGVQEQPAPEEGVEEQPGSPPDLTDALTQMREINSRLDRAGLPAAEEEPGLWDRLTSEPGDEYDEYEEYDDQGQAAPQQMTEEQQVAAELDRRIEERAQAAIQPYVQHIEQERREEKVLQIADQYPGMREPEAINAIDQHLAQLADRYGNPAIRTDPDMVLNAYFAYEARKQAAGQTSTGPAGSEQEGTAEAVGQGGTTLETGAGPGAPPTEMDPQEQAYAQALSSGSKPNKFGF